MLSPPPRKKREEIQGQQESSAASGTSIKSDRLHSILETHVVEEGTDSELYLTLTWWHVCVPHLSKLKKKNTSMTPLKDECMGRTFSKTVGTEELKALLGETEKWGYRPWPWIRKLHVTRTSVDSS